MLQSRLLTLRMLLPTLIRCVAAVFMEVADVVDAVEVLEVFDAAEIV